MSTSKPTRQGHNPDTLDTSSTDIQVHSRDGILPLPPIRIGNHHPAASPGEHLVSALWQSSDRCHLIAMQNRQNGRFNNLQVDGVADAIAQALKLSSDGNEAFFACAEYLTPDSRASANASGACAFWMDIDCGEDKAAAAKGYPTVEAAKYALRKFCHDTGLPQPTHIVHSGGGLHVYWVTDGQIDRDTWQVHARQLKGLTKACGFQADHSRTADIASVLRVPGTFNHKYSQPVPVALKYAAAEFIERSVMLDAITDAHSRMCSAVAIKPPGRHTTAVSTTNASSKTSVSADTYGEPDFDKLASVLVWLDPDCDEETWKLKRLAPLALAARNHPELSSVLYELARSWSSGELCGQESTAWINPGGNGLTGEEAFDPVWQRFLKDEYTGTPVTLGTIYYDAMQVGWDHEDQFQIVDGADEGDA